MRSVLLVVALATTAWAENIVRVVSVEGPTCTLEVLSGSLVNGDEVDVFDGAKKAGAKVKFPSSIDLMMKGDKVAGVSFDGARPVAGALAATKGAFPSAEAVRRALPSAPPTAPAPAPSPALKDSPAACVFTAEELSRALGFKVEAGKGTENAFSGGVSTSCRWNEVKGLKSVVLNRQVMSGGDPTANRAGLRKMLAGRLEDIAGDADQAAWQVDQGDLTDVTLHYFRNDTGVEVRVSGVDKRDRRAVEAMRRKVLSLRRL